MRMFFVMLLALIASAGHAESFEQACRTKLTGPEIFSSSKPIALAEYVDRPTALHLTKEKWKEAEIDHLVLGMTWPEASLEVETAVDFVADFKTGRVCYYPVVSVVWSYKPMRISIPQEIAQGSCTFNTVMEHELEHVRIYREFVPKAAAFTQAALRDRFGQALRYADTENAAVEEVGKTLNDFLAEVIPRAQKLIVNANAAHDSPEESARVLKSCDGQTHAIVKSIVDAT